MGAEKCPNCNKGFLLRTGKGRKRCRFCGHLKHDSPNRREEGTILYPEKEKEEEKTEENIPQVGKRRVIPKGKGYHTDEYEAQKFLRDEQIRRNNKARSIEKILSRLRKNKYNKIKELQIEGELYDVETGKLVREKETEKKKEKDIASDKILKDLIETERG